MTLGISQGWRPRGPMTLGISQGWGFPKSGLPTATYSYSSAHHILRK